MNGKSMTDFVTILYLTTAWQLTDDCLTTAWRLPDDCLTTAWWLPDDCLTAAWRLPHDCLTATWQLSFFSLCQNTAQKLHNGIMYHWKLYFAQNYKISQHNETKKFTDFWGCQHLCGVVWKIGEILIGHILYALRSSSYAGGFTDM